MSTNCDTHELSLMAPPSWSQTMTHVSPSSEAEIEAWSEIKRAASDAVTAAGGTITHHHAVGKLHRPWYDSQRPDLFAESLRAAKRVLDPAGILNPGVLIDPL